MYDSLRAHIAKYIELSEEEFSRCTALFIPKKIRKKAFLLQEGDVCRHLAFVTEGCLRSYTVDPKGDEHVVQFAIEGWWISDLFSFLTGEPGVFYIDALENSEMLLIDRASYEKLCTDVPKFERFFRMILQNNYIATHRRISATLSMSAEEQYLRFVASFPDIVKRVSQLHIASYLGITPEALSRIRKNLSAKKP